MQEKIIETQQLQKTFKVRNWRGQVHYFGAVNDISLHVEAGEIFGFLGPNGAGKSTTLRMLTTLLPPTGGQARIAGYDLLREPDRVREQIGYVSQAGGVDKHATGRENLVLQAQLYGMSYREALKRTDEVLSLLELGKIADLSARTYSGGQRRRLDLGLGIVHRPLLLFLDEPTTGLDPQSRTQLWEEVRRLRALGTTIFLTTHYLEEADFLADRLAIIDGGRIVAEGTPHVLKQQISGDMILVSLNVSAGDFQRAQEMLHGLSFVRAFHLVQHPEMSQGGEEQLHIHVDHGEKRLPAVLRLLDQADLDVVTIGVVHPTLDDVFLRQTGRSLREASPLR